MRHTLFLAAALIAGSQAVDLGAGSRRTDGAGSSSFHHNNVSWGDPVAMAATKNKATDRVKRKE